MPLAIAGSAGVAANQNKQMFTNMNAKAQCAATKGVTKTLSTCLLSYFGQASLRWEGLMRHIESEKAKKSKPLAPS